MGPMDDMNPSDVVGQASDGMSVAKLFKKSCTNVGTSFTFKLTPKPPMKEWHVLCIAMRVKKAQCVTITLSGNGFKPITTKASSYVNNLPRKDFDQLSPFKVF